MKLQQHSRGWPDNTTPGHTLPLVVHLALCICALWSAALHTACNNHSAPKPASQAASVDASQTDPARSDAHTPAGAAEEHSISQQNTTNSQTSADNPDKPNNRGPKGYAHRVTVMFPIAYFVLAYAVDIGSQLRGNKKRFGTAQRLWLVAALSFIPAIITGNRQAQLPWTQLPQGAVWITEHRISMWVACAAAVIALAIGVLTPPEKTSKTRLWGHICAVTGLLALCYGVYRGFNLTQSAAHLSWLIP